MSEKHTPGPWTVKHGTNVMGIRSDVGHEGGVANTGSHGSSHVDCMPESEANARLIAAAPDMLLLLRKYIDEQIRYNIVSLGTVDEIRRLVKAIDSPPATAQQGEPTP